MKENEKTRNLAEGPTGNSDCGCEGNCCPPKKNNMLIKIIFVVILLAAVGIIAVKLCNQPAPAAGKKACGLQGSSSGSDTTKLCDTTKGSSCCPKE